MKIDRVKLKAAIKKAENCEAGSHTWPGIGYPLLFTHQARNELKCGLVKFPYSYGFMASERQLLYAIAAQARGVLAMKKLWIPTMHADGGEKLMDFTQEMQNQLIGDAMKLFAFPIVLPLDGEVSTAS